MSQDIPRRVFAGIGQGQTSADVVQNASGFDLTRKMMSSMINTPMPDCFFPSIYQTPEIIRRCRFASERSRKNMRDRAVAYQVDDVHYLRPLQTAPNKSPDQFTRNLIQKKSGARSNLRDNWLKLHLRYFD